MVFWNSNGESFIIANTEKFIKILPKYYKTQNYSSFVRQLNMYDFHKIKNTNGFHEFRHERFRRGNFQDLKHIKRKINDMIDGIEPSKADASTLLAEQEKLQESIFELEETLKNLNAQNKQLLQANHDFIYSLYHQKTNNDLKYRKLLFLMNMLAHNYLPEVMTFLGVALGQKTSLGDSGLQESETNESKIARFVHQIGKNLLCDLTQDSSYLDKLLEISSAYFRSAGQLSASTMMAVWEDFLRFSVKKETMTCEENKLKSENFNWTSGQDCQFPELDNDSHFEKDFVLDLKSENFNEMDYMMGRLSRQQSSIKSISDHERIFEFQQRSFCLQSPQSESSGI